ncbi:MAG: DedA family protein [Gemmatimonadota bacterium]
MPGSPGADDLVTWAPTPDDLLRFGPALLFIMAVAETAVPAGLLVPAGVAFSTGVFLAHRGLMAWEAVIPAAMVGALVGDSLGFWLGRRGAHLLRRSPFVFASGEGRFANLVRDARIRTARFFRDRSMLAVSGGRAISFVRTFMPATAGASGVPYPRFLIFDGVGVIVWAALYIALGLGAAEGWRALSVRSGPAFLAFAVLVIFLLLATWALRSWFRRGTREVETGLRQPGRKVP